MKTEKHKIVLAPTGYESPIYQLLSKKLFHFKNGNTPILGTFQHLYILSDEEIKDGDYHIFLRTNEIFRVGNKLNEISLHTVKLYPQYNRKIIATTDKSLGLPLISEEFIQYYISKYNKNNIVEEVDVEYEDGLNKPLHEALRSPEPLVFKRLKIENNIINIILKKERIYSSEEVEELLFDALTADGPGSYNMGWDEDAAREYIKQILK